MPSFVYSNALPSSFQATEKLSFHGRVEYFRDKLGDNNQVRGLLFAPDGNPTSPSLAPSDLAEVVAITGTVQYDLWKNVLSRLEFRWDHDADNSDAFGNGVDNVFLLAANIIYKF